MKKLNWNSIVKVKLTERGKNIYYHQYDDYNFAFPKAPIKPVYPAIDADGYSEFQLWGFMALYGKYIFMGAPNVVEDISFYIDEKRFN